MGYVFARTRTGARIGGVCVDEKNVRDPVNNEKFQSFKFYINCDSPRDSSCSDHNLR